MWRRPLFRALVAGGFISPERPVYAVDLEASRLARVSARFPWIETVLATAESVPRSVTEPWTSSARRWSWSTSPTSARISTRSTGRSDPGDARTSRPCSRALGVVFPPARRRSRPRHLAPPRVHGPQHVQFPADRGGRFRIADLERRLLWFPLLDPLLFRVGGRVPGLGKRASLLRVLRAPRVPIPGYYCLEVVVER